MTAGDTVEIRSQHLPNKSPETYLYTGLFGVNIRYFKDKSLVLQGNRDTASSA
jgi:hypothetical protein